MSQLFTREVCETCRGQDFGIGALPCADCSGGFVYTEVVQEEPQGVGPSRAQAGVSELDTIEHALRSALFPSPVGHLFHDAIKAVKALRDVGPLPVVEK